MNEIIRDDSETDLGDELKSRSEFVISTWSQTTEKSFQMARRLKRWSDHNSCLIIRGTTPSCHDGSLEHLVKLVVSQQGDCCPRACLDMMKIQALLSSLSLLACTVTWAQPPLSACLTSSAPTTLYPEWLMSSGYLWITFYRHGFIFWITSFLSCDNDNVGHDCVTKAGTCQTINQGNGVFTWHLHKLMLEFMQDDWSKHALFH